MPEKLEGLVVVEKKNQRNTFQANYDAALDEVRRQTGFTGDLAAPESRAGFFESFSASPIPTSDDQHRGVRIEYKVRSTPETAPAEPRTTGTGSAPRSEVYRL